MKILHVETKSLVRDNLSIFLTVPISFTCPDILNIIYNLSITASPNNPPINIPPIQHTSKPFKYSFIISPR